MRHRVTTVLITVISTLSTTPTFADLDDPLFKLLPSDGATNDEFGYSVAISGTRAIVGAWNDGDNGVLSGSAYIFDTTTGLLLFKLLPDDGEAIDEFGRSVGISGTRAIVGAHGNDDDGFTSGSAYIFDVTTGEQLFKLLANDAEASDAFGWSVAISGTRAIIGARGDDDNGNASGSAYIFDATSGVQLSKVLASDGMSGDRFGWSVAIDPTRAIVGADQTSKNTGTAYLFDVTNGQQIGNPLFASDGAEDDRFGNSVSISWPRAIVGAHKTKNGSAYLFDATNGQQIGNPLQANDAETSDRFGISVAISGTNAIIGAIFDSDNGSSSGSAYLFDATTGKQIAKLLPVDGAAHDWFGWSVAITGTRAIVGAIGDGDNGDDSGSAYLTASDLDTDGDGLLDSWEIIGIPYYDSDIELQHYLLAGADPLHKDLFVEVDSMVGLGFNATAQANVIAAFANAPNMLVNNPDGLDGITLHLMVDETDVPVTPFPNGWVEFDIVKTARFGTPTERANPNWLDIKAAKLKAFRYCVFGHSHGAGSSSGMSELPGNDFMVTMGLWSTPGGTVDQQAGTFMHEFGHALKLRHGGSDNTHRKPNYYSIMNYTWQVPMSGYNAHWRLDYSHLALPTLDEAHLNENNGIGAPAGMFAGVMVPFGGGEPPFITYASMQGGNAVDWNADGDSTDADTAVDINYLFHCGNPPMPCPSPGEMLSGHADWSNLQYSLFGEDFADGVHNNTTQDTEMTVEIFEQLDSIPPPPAPCLADLDGNGTVNTSDMLELFAQWGTAGPADLDGNGIVDVSDLLILFANWGLCE